MASKAATSRKKTPARPGKAVKKVASKGKAKPAKKAAKPAAKPIKAIKASRPKAGVFEARMKLFVEEYLKANFNGSRAAIAVGYSPLNARQQASELLAMPVVQALVAAATLERASRVAIDADDVLKRMHAIATADPRELIELYRCCCRFCWGTNNRFQRTPREMEEAREAHVLKQLESAASDKGKVIGPFDEAGGIGYNPNNNPNPACPECFGRGEEHVVPKDTRDLSPTALLLFAGVKTTQHGLEIQKHDQASMLINIGKHLGMFEKKVRVDGDLNHHHDQLRNVLDLVDGCGTGLPTDGSAD